MENQRVKILGVPFDNLTMDQAVEKAGQLFDGGVHYICTPNPEFVMQAQQDKEFMEILQKSDINLPDGIGVVIGSKIIKQPLKERVAGFDFLTRLFAQSGKSFYLFGGKPGVAELAAQKLAQQGTNVVGHHHGYFDDDSEIIADIKAKQPDILLVCLGAPKQEKWIYNNIDKLNVSLCIGAGGSLDVFAGTVKRAPDIFIKLNLEWFYRLLKQPSRLPRMMNLPKFLLKVIFKGNR